ncbi:PadR family transcriptional regulator [Cellulomonas sp. PhB143]|uniref:PadR family transcriptional regulator n=1 Tax=Cellulomonas sp. PhB143 TaxID=2485186 RepID=UPI001F43DB14|nr:PadR family transcriptional regulator [Cellulomonas sp. PhB143]
MRGAVLTLLAEQPMHGYQIIQEIAERSGGLWQPSAGAVYPALSLLEDEGLVTITAEGGRKLARLTEAGTAHVAERAEEIGDPFTPMGGPGRRAGFALREKVREVGGAAMQIARNGSEAQSRAAVELLERTRQELYLVLAQPAAPTTDAHADADADADAPTEA